MCNICTLDCKKNIYTIKIKKKPFELYSYFVLSDWNTKKCISLKETLQWRHCECIIL